MKKLRHKFKIIWIIGASTTLCFTFLVVGTILREVKAQNTNPPSINSPNAATSKAANSIDGVTLISQNGTTTFPITISQPGSYRLSSNLTVPIHTNGIVIQADNVTIDLNGFSIAGNGSGEGITDNSTAHQGISIRNGTIVNFQVGINLSSSTQNDVEQIRALNNKTVGINVGGGSIVSSSIASGNGGGISARFSIISKNNTSNNNGNGISAAAGSIVINNISNNNFASGISAEGDGFTISGNTTDLNGLSGIAVTNGIDLPTSSTISGNTATANTRAGITVQNCPANLVGNTALDTVIAEETNNILLVGSGCTRANNNPAP